MGKFPVFCEGVENEGGEKREESAVLGANLGERNPRLCIICKSLHKAAKSSTSEILPGIGNSDEEVYVYVCVYACVCVCV